MMTLAAGRRTIRGMEHEPFYTTVEAAAVLKVSERRVQAMIKAGLLQAVRVGRNWAIRHSDLYAFKETRRTRPGRPAGGTRKIAP